MRTDEGDEIIALQPETEVEQSLLMETFQRLMNIADVPEHPQYIGKEVVYYTPDLSDFDDLDLDLWEEREVSVDANGRLNPEPGSRALVVVHSPPAAEPVEEPESDGNHATQEDIDTAVESLKDGKDEDNEYTVNSLDVAEEIDRMLDEDTDYRQLQAWAQDASTTGLMDIPANQSTDDLIEDLEAFVDVALAAEV